MPFFPLASRFMTFLLGHAQKSKFLLDEKVTQFLGFLSFFFFFAFPFSPSLIFLLQWLTFYWACFPLKNSREIIIEMGNTYHGVANCTQRKFCSEFSTQISEHFHAYFRLHSLSPPTRPHHSDLGIIGKIFSFGRTSVEIIICQFLVKGDDVMASYGRHRNQ